MVWDKEELAGMMQTVSQSFVKDPTLKIDHSFFDLPREKQIGFNMKRAARMLELSKEGKFPQVSMMNIGLIADKSGSISAVGLHFGMFETVIRYLGSDEQVKEYEQDVLDLKITGCYAQTEIGHGSDVSSLETTAIFDKETDSFIINSPSLTSGKWWPGELGKTSTHAVFHAQMIIGDKNYGVQSFICQIRDLNTHRPLRGLEIGDIGPKGGYNQKDNGYMYFKNFAVPRTALLSRYIKVDREGNFSVNGDPKIAYATMMFIRIYLIHVTSLYPVVGLLIAIRYAIFRKQFKTLKDGTAERKIMDYQAHQTTLVPILAFSFAALFTKTKMYWDYFEMMDKIHKKNDFKMLKDMHSIASCLKSFYTDRTLEDLKIIRECWGGHGFSAYSGLPNLIDCVSPNVTLEGDNTVMYQQTAAHLVKSCASILQGKQLKNSLVYLNDISTFEEQQLKKFDSENIDELISIVN